ncbi:MAG: type II toxin-antitoxin system VapC family toxin [Burkholderiales bacterium]|nr:type II toxin-antitoxin system VapC family toxin [Burkholderiales bacterium]
MLLIDTDVLIDFLRGRPEALAYVAELPRETFVSVITVAELYVGVREGAERQALDDMLATFYILPLEVDTARLGGLLRRDYGKGHGVGLNDALIAASALKHELTLVTLNLRHYPMLPEHRRLLPYRKEG